MVEPLGPVESSPDAGRDYPVIAIVGPTGAGKSALGIVLAERLQGEIVNYDSVQLYRGFNIGAGKVSPQERRGIPHHLIDSVEPHQVFTAGDFRREALRVLGGIRGRRKIPVLVGGTGLYLRALLQGLFEGPTRSEKLRTRLRAIAERRGREFLHRVLRRFDPPTAQRIAPRDTQKVIRGLEVYFLSRQPLSVMLARGREGLRGFRVFKIGLKPEQGQLYERINRRVERIFAAGLLDETRVLLARPDASQFKPLESLGYRQACAALRGKISIEDAIRKTQVATRHYAKRQLTWYRRETDVTWFAGFGDNPEVQSRVLEWLQAQDELRTAEHARGLAAWNS